VNYQSDSMDNLSRRTNELSAGLGFCATVVLLVGTTLIGMRTGFVPWVAVLPLVLLLFATGGYLLRSGRRHASKKKTVARTEDA
jgi:hypothetical protein